MNDTVRRPDMEAKALVESLKIRVDEMNRAFPQLKADAQTGMRGGWRALDAHRKEHRQVLAQLRTAKIDLAKLSGTTGTDPKWQLIARGWSVLIGLENAGVDIGERGRALVEDIEFHVPNAKLEEQAAADAEADSLASETKR